MISTSALLRHGMPVKTFLLAFAWLLLMRGVMFLHAGFWPSLVGMLLSDVLGAFLLAVLLRLASSRRSRYVLVALLGLAYYAAGQHLAVHETLFRLVHIVEAASPTFLDSNVFTLSLLLLPIYLGLAWLLHYLDRRLVASDPGPSRPALISALVALGVYIVAAPSLTTPANNLVAGTLAQVPAMLLQLDEPERPAGTIVKKGPGLETDFFQRQVGAPSVDEPPNVLLVMIEGLSAGYLPSVSGHHDLSPAVSLPDLERSLGESGFRVYRNVLSMQRQTNRGSYAILCGDYARLRSTTPKMTELAEDRVDADCLPARLRDDGFRTAYWQAAPLEFMEKDAAMPRIGFEQVLGAESLGVGDDVDGWGAKDALFFPVVAERLRTLDRETAPWFVTLLNVGTHHPYTLEEDGAAEASELAGLWPSQRQQERRRAMKVMEEHLTDFLESLANDGVLDDTLVILTSDEAGSFLREGQQARPLDGNFGMMAIRLPEGASSERLASRDRLVAQIDVPLTVTDVTGARPAGGMIGHSMLAGDGTEPRGLLLADTYMGRKFFLHESGRLLACTELLIRCESWRFNPQRLFGSLEETDREPYLSLEERWELMRRASLIRTRQSSEE